MCKLIFPKKTPPLPTSLLYIKKKLKKKRKQQEPKKSLSSEELAIINYIKVKTSSLNINNVTRTNAYLDFYNRHPEIHWAFLAHMVSRNGGWNMTDLKGNLLSNLLNHKEATSFFTFLERGNWLIFQDAYPQLLVYEESKKRGKSLFKLFEHLHVSIFMETIWNQFWEDLDSYILSVALIINEQNYIESRVLENSTFQKEVINTFEFKIQDFLSMNHILFPYVKNGKTILTGQTVHHFEKLHERILIGKRLYTILFNDKPLLKRTKEWANKHPHSGSRKDYWPHIFNDVDEGIPGALMKPRVRLCKLLPGSARFYSPKLVNAWRNIEHQNTQLDDWYSDSKVLYYLIKSKDSVKGNIVDEYCTTLERLDILATTKKAISEIS